MLWEGFYHALHVPPGGSPFDPEIVRHPQLAPYVEDWMTRDGDLGFVAESDGAPVGVIWLRLWSEAYHGFGFVDAQTPELSMAVWPGYRGLGIGTALLERILEVASAHHEAVSLSVNSTNRALHLYERFGFERIGTPSEDSITMQKAL